MQIRILSWNLLHTIGAGATDIARLVEQCRPDLALFQESTAPVDALPDLIGGHYVRKALGRYTHGQAAWSRRPFEADVVALPLSDRLDLPVPLFRSLSPRHALVIRQSGLEIASVHLDHGQLANRRQLRGLLECCSRLDVIIGDYNALGTTSLPGFADVGPRCATHLAYGFVPLRLDRCLVRGMACVTATALDFGRSDHRPILIELISDSRTGKYDPLL